jgi:hypothetical protein
MFWPVKPRADLLMTRPSTCRMFSSTPNLAGVWARVVDCDDITWLLLLFVYPDMELPLVMLKSAHARAGGGSVRKFERSSSEVLSPRVYIHRWRTRSKRWQDTAGNYANAPRCIRCTHILHPQPSTLNISGRN